MVERDNSKDKESVEKQDKPKWRRSCVKDGKGKPVYSTDKVNGKVREELKGSIEQGGEEGQQRGQSDFKNTESHSKEDEWVEQDRSKDGPGGELVKVVCSEREAYEEGDERNSGKLPKAA
jgi:hypothetical protein